MYKILFQLILLRDSLQPNTQQKLNEMNSKNSETRHFAKQNSIYINYIESTEWHSFRFSWQKLDLFANQHKWSNRVRNWFSTMKFQIDQSSNSKDNFFQFFFLFFCYLYVYDTHILLIQINDWPRNVWKFDAK